MEADAGARARGPGRGGSAREQVRKVTALLLRTWRRDPDLVRVLVHEVTRSPEDSGQIDEISHAYEALQGIVVHGQETGEFRSDFRAQLAATIFYGALEEVLTGWVMGQLPDTDEDIARAGARCHRAHLRRPRDPLLTRRIS